MLCNPARSPFRASSRGTFSSSSVVTESIWTSLRTATRAIEFQRRLIPVSKSALVSLCAKLLIIPFSLYNEFRYTARLRVGAINQYLRQGGLRSEERRVGEE